MLCSMKEAADFFPEARVVQVSSSFFKSPFPSDKESYLVEVVKWRRHPSFLSVLAKERVAPD